MKSRSPLRIGVSACFFHSDPKRPVFKGKTLLYLEQSLAHWINGAGVLAYLLPTVQKGSALKVSHMVKDLDGLVLHGGSDVSPRSYGETSLRPEWEGDYIRDCYEIDLVRGFHSRKKPILGVCRGAQILNVAFGGTLYQDIQTQIPSAQVHRNWEVYDQLFHELEFEPKSRLSKLYAKSKIRKVNTVHHQGLKDLGKGFLVEARSLSDGVIEAIRHKGPSYVLAVQWHPEFHDPKDKSLLDGKPILKDFLKEAKR